MGLAKGMTVSMKPTGNFARGWNARPRHGVVEKIGRKYVHVKMTDYGRGTHLFDKDTLEYIDAEEANGGYELFPDDEAFEKEMDRRFMMQEILASVHLGALQALDYEQVCQIYELVTGEAIGANTAD